MKRHVLELKWKLKYEREIIMGVYQILQKGDVVHMEDIHISV